MSKIGKSNSEPLVSPADRQAGNDHATEAAEAMTTFAEECAAARRECYEAREAIRRRDRPDRGRAGPLDYADDHPDPARRFNLWGYSDALEAATGYGLRELGWGACPPGGRNSTQLWIAVMRTSHSEHETHAILCCGATLLHDSAGIFRAYQPTLLLYGLGLVEA